MLEQSNTTPVSEEIVFFPLADGYVAKISRDDLPLVSSYTWRTCHFKRSYYPYASVNGRRIYMHRLLGGGKDYWDPEAGRWKAADLVDHIDRDTLNITRSNLRIGDYSKNQQNSLGKPSQRRSRFKGVSYCRNRKKPWRATITVRGHQMHGGHFNSEEEAAASYNKLASEYFGEFARLNDIDNMTQPSRNQQR